MGRWDCIWSKAIGATLLSVEHNSQSVRFMTSRGVMTLTPQGDCCSHSWIESVDEHGAIGGEITTWDEGRCESLDNGEEKQYFPFLSTTKGRVHIEMRNSSNGYYGGWLNESWSPNGEGA